MGISIVGDTHQNDLESLDSKEYIYANIQKSARESFIFFSKIISSVENVECQKNKKIFKNS